MNITTLNPKPHYTLFIFLLSISTFPLLAQMQVVDGATAPFTPTNLISNVFLGSGVEVTDIQYAGKDGAVGYFSDAAAAVGIERGIVMTTGRVEPTQFYPGIDGDGLDFLSYNNNSTAADTDLKALLGPNPEPLKNVAVYTIKFIPTADTIRFKYCFASEEYPEYSCSEYNDVFGFFIQGPGYPNYTNIALVPNSIEPVAINTVHPFNNQNNVPYCPPKNEQYYNDNLFSNNQPVFDGFTDVFVAQAAVTPCVEYTIKLSIGDVSDELYDSGVFLEAKSFSTRNLSYEILTESQDATLTEGCSAGTLSFVYSDPVEYYTPLDLNFFGSATNGVDIDTLPSNIAFNPGESRLSIDIEAFADNINEGMEYIAVDYPKDACTRDTLYIYIRENALLRPDLPEDTTVCQAGLTPFLLDATSPTAAPDIVPFSNTQNITVSPISTPVFSDIR